MNRTKYLRILMSLVIIFTMLSPVTIFAFGDGKKHFKAGMDFETSEDWDKAAEEFALAVTADPKNPEYKLHLQRSLFNASQMYIKKGTTAANEKDYENAYLYFRKAYAFDPANELAKSEMERMVRLQKEVLDGKGDDNKTANPAKVVKTAYDPSQAPPQLPPQLEKLRDLPFSNGIDLQFIIKELAKDLDLNVLFDAQSFRSPRKTNIELKNVTAAFALDCIFLQEGLFFQKVGPRTILVANSDLRTRFQQLVLRTFYLQNANPKDIAKVVQTAIPAQPGRSQTIVLTDDATNSITIRDTSENIKLIGQLISSLDKDRAEVVMDVAIYEVNKSDLMTFGNQIGTADANGNATAIGGVGFPVVNLGSSGPITQAMNLANLAKSAFAIGLPISNIQALQTRSNTKLLASTQIHAFNNEDSSATIGQRVPVQSAQFVTGGGVATSGEGVVSNVINYEQVGLTMKFKPLVFPNQDVQVAMEITSKDVAGASTLTPTFTERTIKGTARVQNNKTLLLASVAQDVETHGRSGLPLVGLIPIIGRLFTAPTKDNRQVDIVIAVTPRVIRAPAILPIDEVERDTGSLAVPTQNSLEAMIIQEDQEEMLAAARKNPTNANVQLPDQPNKPEYVRTSGDTQAESAVPKTAITDPGPPALKPIDNGTKTLQLKETADIVKPADTSADTPKTDVPTTDAASPPSPTAEISLNNDLSDMKAGTRAKIAVSVEGSSEFSSAVLGLRYDDKKLAVRSITLGDAFGPSANTVVTPFLNQNGRTYVSLAPKDSAAASGVIAYIEVEALADGKPVIAFDHDVMNLMTGAGKNFVVTIKDQ